MLSPSSSVNWKSLRMESMALSFWAMEAFKMRVSLSNIFLNLARLAPTLHVVSTCDQKIALYVLTCGTHS